MDYSGARCQECKFLRVNSVTKATKQCLLVCLLNRWGRSFTVMYKFASDLSSWYVWRLWIAFPSEKPSWKVKTIKTLLFYGMGGIAFSSSSTYIIILLTCSFSKVVSFLHRGHFTHRFTQSFFTWSVIFLRWIRWPHPAMQSTKAYLQPAMWS